MKMLDNVAISYLLTDWCKEANLQPCKVQFKIDRENLNLNIYTPNPGYLIGRQGLRYEKYKIALLEKEEQYKCEEHLQINLVETTQADFWVDYDYMGDGM